MKFIFLIILFFANVFAANETVITKKQADKLAIEYTKTKSLSNLKTQNFSDGVVLSAVPLAMCQPGEVSCVQVLCDKTGQCGFQSSFDQIASACRGVSGDCVQVLCDKTGQCGFISSAMQIAQSCQASNGECTRVGCDKTGQCGFITSATQIAQACVGVYDGGCVTTGCERTGGCGFISNFTQIAKSCAGN